MEYRTLGRTGMKASVIGLGAEHLDGHAYEVVEETIRAAIDNQINIIDVFMPGEDIRQKIGRALEGLRDKVILQGHIGSTDINQQYDISRDLDTNKRYFESLLTDLQTDYIDVGMLFMVDNEENFNQVFHTDIIKYASDLKKQGVIKAIGASSHDPKIAKKMVETGLVELLMFSINPAFDMAPSDVLVTDYLSKEFEAQHLLEIDADRLALYTLCKKLNIPITVMKTLGGGKLLQQAHTPFKEALTVTQCIHYALSQPGVASALIGCQSKEEVEQAVAYLATSPWEKDFTDAISHMNDSFRGNCVYCNHCLPCPVSIDIAAVTKYMDLASVDGNSTKNNPLNHYAQLDAHGSDCIACGDCEKKCPFDVSVIENMQKAATVFGY